MVADRMRRVHVPGARPATTAEVATSVQRVLEEGGVQCVTSTELDSLKGYVISSPYGAEITISERLDPSERLDLYAQLLAHALVGTVDAGPRAVLAALWSEAFGRAGRGDGVSRPFFVHLEYVEGRAPPDLGDGARRERSLATILAEAILGGHVELAPRYAFDVGVRTPRGRGVRAAVGRIFLEACHRTSLALFWRSPRYRRLRANRQVTGLASQVEGIVIRTWRADAA